MASVGYRYRKWDLDNGIVLVTRCQHDAVIQAVNGEMQYINVKALNEWDPRVRYNIQVANVSIQLDIIWCITNIVLRRS